MNYRVWYSTESFANFVIQHTSLKNKNVTLRKMYESDANNQRNFHSLPDHIKKILYLDAPDLIVELNTEPIFSIEVSAVPQMGVQVEKNILEEENSPQSETRSINYFISKILRLDCTPNLGTQY